MTEFNYAKFLTWSEIADVIMPHLSAIPGILQRGIGLWHDSHHSWGVKCRIDMTNPDGYIDLCNRINNNRPGETHRMQKNDYVQMSPAMSTRYLCMLGLLDNRLAENPIRDVTYAVTELGVFFLYEIKKTGKNTRISYCYHDASNYKKHNECIIQGEISETQKAEIMACLNDGEYFNPSMVDLPAVRFEDTTEDDHDWFEFGEFESTDAAPTVDMSIDTLVERFKKAAALDWADV